jgi:hypothetical protein
LERAGDAIKKKRASKIGVPYDTGKSSAKQADNPLHEISAPVPVLPGFNFGSVSSKSPIVEEGPKETAQAVPSVPRFPPKPVAPAITDKVQTSKNPFAGINFSSGGSENTTQSVTANIGKEIKAPVSSYGSIIPVGESKGSPFGALASQTSDHAKLPGSSPFGFGSTGATFGAAASTDKPQAPSLTAFAGFGDKNRTLSFGGAATDKSKETSTPTGFTFGTPSGDTFKEKTNTPSLLIGSGSSIGFGANTDKETKDTSKASPFTFGGAASTEILKESSKASSFTFGGAASTETPKEPSKASPFTFGGAASSSATKETIKAPAFSFGNTGDKNKEPVNAPLFSFGNTSDKAKEPTKTPAFSFGSAGEAAKEAAQASNATRYSLDKNPFALSTNKARNASNASNAPNFTFNSNLPSTEKSNDSGSSIFRFGASETSTPTAGSSGMSQERSNKKKRQLGKDIYCHKR